MTAAQLLLEQRLLRKLAGQDHQDRYDLAEDLLGFARAIRGATSIPVIAVGLITEAKQAEAIIKSHDADLVAMARAMLWDPRWPWHAAATLGAQIHAPKQYWRSAPRDLPNVIAHAKVGQR